MRVLRIPGAVGLFSRRSLCPVRPRSGRFICCCQGESVHQVRRVGGGHLHQKEGVHIHTQELYTYTHKSFENRLLQQFLETQRVSHIHPHQSSWRGKRRTKPDQKDKREESSQQDVTGVLSTAGGSPSVASSRCAGSARTACVRTRQRMWGVRRSRIIM